MKQVVLTLCDGTRWEGFSANGLTEAEGEVVFTTAGCGYPQSLTDPSYNGQVLVFAFPLVGNYGVDEERLESGRPWVKAVIASSLTGESRLGPVLEEWLQARGIPAVSGVDTRALVRHLRERGTVMGRVSPEGRLPEKTDLPRDLAIEASVKELKVHNEASGGPRIALLDYGVKANIVREFLRRDCTLFQCPAGMDAASVLALRPDGIVLSNGPGDPSWLGPQVETVAALLGKRPLWGICLGLQVMALAAGAKTYKLPYGHRGANHAVAEAGGDRGWITSQNHGYAADGDSLRGTGFSVSFRHLGDGSVEGIQDDRAKAWAVQFHPEAFAGPRDTGFLFDDFLKGLK